MNQRQLKYFLSIYKHKSITKAAEEMYISPQGISKTLALLESELGVSLFEHKSNSIVPTKAANRLACHAKNLLAEYDYITNSLFTDGNTKNELLIHCSYDVPQLLSPVFFSEFNARHPEILIKLQEYPDADILNAVSKNKIELAIVAGPLNYKKLNCELLCSEPFCIVVNKGHPLASYKEISIRQLDDVPLAVKDMSNPDSIQQYDELLKNNIIPNIIIETTDAHLIHKMAEDNIAAGMSLMYLAKKIRSPNIVVIPFKEKWLSKSIYIVSNKNDTLSYIAKTFKECLMLTMGSSHESNLLP
ncbi:MAG: LysR family transcriptional regulator [Coprococcus sp.]|nr:LysR family transcriptional regulator [Coprococcus sp.]